MALAPERFAQWIARHEHRDEKYGWVYQYHPRSDAHSVALCEMILEDLLAVCDVLRQQALAGSVVYGINYEHAFPLTKKRKSLDLAIGVGTPDTTAKSLAGIYQGSISSLRLSCENKPTMTEHSKFQPRMFDELSASHEALAEADQDTVLNYVNSGMSGRQGKHGPPAILRLVSSCPATPPGEKPRSFPLSSRRAVMMTLAQNAEEGQRQLRASEQWLRVTLFSIGDAVITTDSTGRVTFLNPVAESLTG